MSQEQKDPNFILADFWTLQRNLKPGGAVGSFSKYLSTNYASKVLTIFSNVSSIFCTITL